MAFRDSRIPGFYKLPLPDRRQEIVSRSGVSADTLTVFDRGGLDRSTADRMVENAIGVYGLPLGLGLNFRINGQDFAVPMAVEEPSVIAAASNAARMVRAGGGFVGEADEPVMTAQVELLDVPDVNAAEAAIETHKAALIAKANAFIPRMVERGGGTKDIEVRVPSRQFGGTPDRVVVHLHIDCRDAMGANLINTVAESLAPELARLSRAKVGLRILTNLCDRRLIRLSARVPFGVLAASNMSGEDAAFGIASASRFAEEDPYRASTHNKGIMNGVDAVVIATGNDWRGVEAGAHAFAAITGRYLPLARWWIEDESVLAGQLIMPMAVGTVGGTLGVHAGARAAQQMLGVTSSNMLAMVIGAVGMASNLAALRALATEGIQRGHMACHRRATSEVPLPATLKTASESADRISRSVLVAEVMS
ncbi:MAG: hydroxymethylglutaryl-CoA reductase, degradative [Deltaproteobacteria bacterium]|nr:hydroxymethylglutaryl-CoA reductase, degradative [Deltaproteobacteria bacterium]